MLKERLIASCTNVLPDATIIVHGSLALGDFQPGKSDVDLLVLSDAPTDGLAEAVERAWKQGPGNFDLRVVRYAVAATPTRRPHMALSLAAHGETVEVERDKEEPDLVIELSVCRQLGHSDLIGPVPDEWVDEVGLATLERWKAIGNDSPHHELMALTACRIWRFREERLHCSKPAAAQWARQRGAHVAYDEKTVRDLLEYASN